GISMISHSGLVMAFYFAAQTLTPAENLPSLITHFLIVPVGMTIRAGVPLPGGIGGGEYAFGMLYQVLGYSFAAGVLGLLAQRVVEWSLGLVGYLVFLRMKPALRQAEAEAAPELAAADVGQWKDGWQKSKVFDYSNSREDKGLALDERRFPQLVFGLVVGQFEMKSRKGFDQVLVGDAPLPKAFRIAPVGIRFIFADEQFSIARLAVAVRNKFEILRFPQVDQSRGLRYLELRVTNHEAAGTISVQFQDVLPVGPGLVQQHVEQQDHVHKRDTGVGEAVLDDEQVRYLGNRSCEHVGAEVHQIAVPHLRVL